MLHAEPLGFPDLAYIAPTRADLIGGDPISDGD